jgi:hypothetical protein
VFGEEIEDDGGAEGDGCYDGVVCRTVFMGLLLTWKKILKPLSLLRVGTCR